jgi:hypothetical protein
MLFDPFEEQLYLPTIPIEFGDRQRWKTEVVGQKDKPLVGLFIVVFDPTRFVGIVLRGIDPSEYYSHR